MLKSLKTFFDGSIAATTPGADDASEGQLRIATAALFVEMTRADFEAHDIESQAVIESLRTTLGIDEAAAHRLLELAEAEAEEAIELFQFTRLVDSEFTASQKIEIVENLWAVAMADDHIDHREEHLVRKVADLLHVPHREFIEAKKRARAR